VDIPTGVIVKNNTVSGYQQPSDSDGFGIVVESLQPSVYGNTLTNNDVGIQRQAGHLPYTPNTNVDGDQSNVVDQYFGRGNSPVVCAQVGSNTYTGNGVNTRDVGPVNAAPCGFTAFAHFLPTTPITVSVGTTFSLDLLINSGGHTVRAQQSYLTFPQTMLQNIVVGSNGTPANSATPDLTSLETVLQNQVCNGPTPCTFGSLVAPAGSIAYASGTFNANPPTGDFRVAQVAFSANQVGTATIHWQFSPPDPLNRNRLITDGNNQVISGPTLYQDYVIHIVSPQFVGHVTWQGRPAQPSALQALPLTLTLTEGPNVYTYTNQMTDLNGNFAVAVDNLPDGTYTWRVKGPTYLSSSGSVVLNHALSTTVEMGLQRAGDANNDNLVDISDFGILYASFGHQYPDPLFDARADWTGDQLVDIDDFGWLQINFGQLGNRPVESAKPQQTGGSAVLEPRPQGKAPANGGTVHVGDRFVLELWVNAQPGTTVNGQQSYLTFPANALQLGGPTVSGRGTNTAAQVVPDARVLDLTLQNVICNGLTGCTVNGLSVPGGSLAFASGTLAPTGGSGAFRIGQVTVQATAPGLAQLHWQVGPTAPANRTTKILTHPTTASTQDLPFVDYAINILPAVK
jgi:hypothetical protein